MPDFEELSLADQMVRDYDERAEAYHNRLTLWASDQWVVRSADALIQLEPHQRWLLDFLFTRDERGRFPYQTVVYSDLKKSGKTEIGGMVGLWLASTEGGMPEVYMCANDREQSRARAFSAVQQVIRKNPNYAAQCVNRKDTVYLPDGAFIQTVAVDFAGEAGANQALTVWDELWAYTSENARRLWDEFTPVPTRLNSLRLVTTYAGFRGESELLWDLYTRGTDKRRGARPIPNPYGLALSESKDGTLCVYWNTEPRMPWQTEEYYRQQRAELRPSAYARLHRNKWVAAESAFISPEQWEALPGWERPEPSKAYPVYVGVDAAHKRDCTAAVAVGWLEGRPRLVRHQIWTPRPGDPVIPEDVVIPWVDQLAKDFRVERVRYDPAHFESAGDRARRTGPVQWEEYTQTPAHLTAIAQALYDAIRYRYWWVYEAPDLREHVLNVVAQESPRGWKMTKAKQKEKMDAAVASGIAVDLANERGPLDAGRGSGLYLVGQPEGDPDDPTALVQFCQQCQDWVPGSHQCGEVPDA
jgi:phage terminase large subunit-like protein